GRDHKGSFHTIAKLLINRHYTHNRQSLCADGRLFGSNHRSWRSLCSITMFRKPVPFSFRKLLIRLTDAECFFAFRKEMILELLDADGGDQRNLCLVRASLSSAC